MHSAGGQAQKHVAGLNLVTGNHFALLNYANTEACDIVFAFGVEAGHFGSFAADKSTAAFLAGIGNTLNDVGNLLGINLIYCNVIQEEQGLCALYQDIVNAHCYSILTDSIMLISHESQFQFSAYAVSTADEHRLLVFAAV